MLSQPSLPMPVSPSRRRAIDCGDRDLDAVAGRCADGLRVLGLRFDSDPFVPAERFAFLRERLGEGVSPPNLGEPRYPPGRHGSSPWLGRLGRAATVVPAVVRWVVTSVDRQRAWRGWLWVMAERTVDTLPPPAAAAAECGSVAGKGVL